MKFPAVINDPDGFTYVRERPSTKSKAKTKIRRNQIFLYTPIWGSDWCRAYSDDGSLFIGYIYRKRILPFDKCPVDTGQTHQNYSDKNCNISNCKTLIINVLDLLILDIFRIFIV